MAGECIVVHFYSCTFFLNQTQLSPCDKRLPLVGSAKVALFRPKVDEISFLSVNSSDFRLVCQVPF